MKSLLRLCIISFCWVLTTALLHPLRADDQPAPLRVGIYSIFPFYYMDSNGETAGANYELTSYILGELNMPFQLTVKPLARILQEIEHGTIDLMLAYRLPKILPNLAFSSAIGCQRIVLIPLKGSGVKTMGDLSGKRIAYLQGGRFDMMHSHRSDFTHVKAVDYIKMFQLVEQQRIHAFVANMMAYRAHRAFAPRESGLPPQSWDRFDTPHVVMAIETSFLTSPKSKFFQLLPAVNSFIGEAYKAGKFAPIFRKYGENTGGSCITVPPTPGK